MKNMTVGEGGVTLIKKFEGKKLKAYKPIPEDPWTIGYGHTRGVKEDDKISNEKAEEFLLEDLAVYEACINSYVMLELGQNEFDALISFTYNLGCPNLRSSTLLRLLNAGDRKGAAEQFPRWNRAAGKVMRGLTRRRLAERELFLS
jgi:lysozyme